MKKISENKSILPIQDLYFSWGTLLLIFSLASSLISYYLYSSIGRQLTILLMLLSLVILFLGMFQDLKVKYKNLYILWIIIFLIIIIYFFQRMEMHRFDFMVGDASDYFAAGICSVTYGQDIGYILPLSATITAVGYEIFGIENILFSYVIFYLSSVPLFYYLFRKLNLSESLSLLMSTFLIFIPLSIWYSKSSFSEPIWQILLFVFIINSYSFLQKYTLSWKNIILAYMIFFLAPMLRVEGVFYYGLITFLALFHFWKYSNYKIFIFNGVGLFIIAISTHITLRLRSDYMLHRQFNRIIPHASEENVMFALYGLAIFIMTGMLFIYLFKKIYRNLPFPASIVILSILFKLTIGYLYAIKKDTPYLNMLVINEYDFAVGNFGLPIAIIMAIGLILLYIQAFKGHILPLLLIIVYTVFYIPFVMQASTFVDPHAFLFYWNRYYFSVLMIIHLFALGVFLRFFHQRTKEFINNALYQNLLFGLFIITILITSYNFKLYKIVVNESHLKGSHKFYSWVKERVGWSPLSLVTDKQIVYSQNNRSDGQEAMKYFTVRTFSIHKMNILNHKTVPAGALYSSYPYKILSNKLKYVICIGTKPCKLKNNRMVKVDSFYLPLEWREHFGLDENASTLHHEDITQSVIKHLPFHATLYKIKHLKRNNY